MMTAADLDVGGQRSWVWTGGAGEPLVLVHGGWGGAQMHWALVWDVLAERFRLIAPELPGIAAGVAPGPGSWNDFARWLTTVLDARRSIAPSSPATPSAPPWPGSSRVPPPSDAARSSP